MNKFCSLPWTGLHITTQGSFSPCCKSQNNFGNSYEEYLNSNKLQILREEFLAGKLPSNCNLCWKEESKNLLSLRQYYTDFVKIDGLSEYKVLHITFGNICNLACRTCSSAFSSRWITDEKKLYQISKFDFKAFHKEKSFLDDLKNISKNLKHITFSGGEVFYSGIKEHLDYLDFLIEHNCEEITLNYITNSTLFPSDQFWSKWQKFKKVIIELSIDGIGNKFEYIRYPANWNLFYNNLQKYKENQDKITISISHTVSFFNIFYLDDFYLWCLKEKLPLPYLNIVHGPVEFNVQELPETVKQKLRNKLKRYAIFDPVLNFLNNQSSIELTQILEKVYAVDKIRDQNFHQIFPEFSNLLLE